MNITINATDLFDQQEITSELLEEAVLQQLRKVKEYDEAQMPIVFDTVRLGAETCANTLRYTSADDFRRLADNFHRDGKQVQFVTPVVPEYAWPTVSRLLTTLARSGAADRFVANDFGIIALSHDLGVPVVCGRMFDKRLRDPRVDSNFFLNGKSEECGIFTEAYLELLRRENITDVELEALELGLGGAIPECIQQVAFHVPYTLVTCGMICEFAGIAQPNDQKFHIGQCTGQCRRVNASTRSAPLRTRLVKRCNAVYMGCMCQKAQLASMTQDPRIRLILSPFVR